MPAKLYQRMRNPPVRKSTKDRQRIDRALDTYRESEVYQRLSGRSRRAFDEAIANLKQMTPSERARFYQENSIWVSKIFDYREEDEDGIPEFANKNQLGKKVNAFLRATQKQYTLDQVKQMAKVRKSSIKKPRRRSSLPKLTVQDVDKQIADLERQLEQLKQLRAKL